MHTASLEEQASKVASFNGINVFHIKAEKFKTNAINIFFHDDLRRETAAKNALVPAVLRRGCRRLPTFQQIALYLEELYGATFDCGVAKKGERQITQYYIEFIADQYAGEKEKLFEKAFDLLYEIITQPVLEDGGFKGDYTEQEKENLKRLIESRVNDKVQYAVEKCYEAMCAEESFGVYEYGEPQDVGSIGREELFAHYQASLETLPMDVFISGTVAEEDIRRVTERLSGIKRGKIKEVSSGSLFKEPGEIRYVTEKLNVSQGKLSLGFRTRVAPDSEDYYRLLVYNGILGGGGFMHSKLFQNVREKASLAYYVFSRLEKFKGLMVISSGIEIQNKDQAMEIILQQMDEMRRGNISDYEYASTLKTIETGIKSLRDNQLQIVDFYLSQAIAGTADHFETVIEKTQKVTKQDIISIAEKIRLDTVYFLTTEAGR